MVSESFAVSRVIVIRLKSGQVTDGRQVLAFLQLMFVTSGDMFFARRALRPSNFKATNFADPNRETMDRLPAFCIFNGQKVV